MGMRQLPTDKRARILNMMVEGMSMRSISRLEKCSINTVSKLLVDAGNACLDYHDETVVGLKSERVECDEIWSFCYAKEKNADAANTPDFAGDVWTWTSIDADSKLMVNWFVGGRDADFANHFMLDLAARLDSRVQLTSDGHKPYLKAVEGAFGDDIDYAMLVKLYGNLTGGKGHERKYSPAECNGTKKKARIGNPDMKKVSTSYAERQNLTMRMSMRRFTRLTNAFSKKFDNHCHALALYFVYYNFCRTHKTLGTTPAIASGLTDTVHDMEWVVGLIDAANPPKKRGPYKKSADISK
jgi:IS1 family transposase